MPESDVWARIKAKQAELDVLFAEAATDIYKETKGEAFLGEDNMSFADYWLGAVQKYPQVMTGLFNTPDFATKLDLFKAFVIVYNDNNAGKAILDAPYDIMSKDLLRYALEAQKSFDAAASNDATYKQVIKDAPQYRKSPQKKTSVVQTTDVPKVN